MPVPGDPAPPFEGVDQHGDTVRLQDFAGRPLALYVYPKDDTPGCTKQACNLRDHTSDLEAAGVAVVGVSPDDSASHERFADKHDLPFPLLADPDKTVLQAYGAWGEKTLYGRRPSASSGRRSSSGPTAASSTSSSAPRRPRTRRRF